ncbi:MAG: phosphoserine phosphatase SerB [Acetobacteraceae bacterium]
MSYVLTLVADRSNCRLEDATLRDVQEALALAPPTILSPGEAAEFSSPSRPNLGTARGLLRGAPIDAVATPQNNRRKALLVADMDGTIVADETIDELAARAGLKTEIATITRAGMNGEIDFAEGLSLRVRMLKGLPATALEETWQSLSWTAGARALVATMRAHGATAALVSGGFSYFTSRLAIELGFDAHRANTLLLENGAICGRVAEPILDRHAKLAALREFAVARKLPLEATLAVGDGANDLPMLLAAGLGVAFHAKPVVAAAARARIDFCDLRALLFVQGYSAAEIIEE